LSEYCLQNQIPLVDIGSKLRDEHFADGLHPNEEGARIIAETVIQELTRMRQEEETR